MALPFLTTYRVTGAIHQGSPLNFSHRAWRCCWVDKPGSSETQMSQLERNKKLVLGQHREVWSHSDPEAVDRYYAPEVILHFAGRQVKGRSGIRAIVEARRNAFPDWHEEVELIIAEGDLVSSRVTSTATHTGPFLGIEASNKR